MAPRTATVAAFAAAASLALISQASAAEDIGFETFRPKFHILPEKNWMNDPCGPWYDAETGTYHVYAQYNPCGAQWGHMHWYHWTSKDMVHWKDETIAIKPDDDTCGAEYALGTEFHVFSGGVISTPEFGTVAYYTSCEVPPTWMEPYSFGEKQRWAVSKDRGYTFEKEPIVAPFDAAPNGFDVLGWRDPFVFQSEYLEPNTWFMLLASGERHNTETNNPGHPKLLLYKSTDPVNAVPGSWTYQETPFLQKQGNTSFCSDNPSRCSKGAEDLACGTYATNFEVANYFDLPVEGTDEVKHIVFMASEGAGTARPEHPNGKSALWGMGKVQNTDGALTWEPTAVGLLDSGGIFYATNTFWDKDKRRILLAWHDEEMTDGTLRDKQGWSGMLVVPRHLYIKRLPGVAADSITTTCMYDVTTADDGTHTVDMLAMEFIDLHELEGVALLDSQSHEQISATSLRVAGNHFHAHVTADFPGHAGSITIHVGKSSDGAHHTDIVYDAAARQLSIVRTASTPFTGFDTNTRIAFHELWTVGGEQEHLDLDIYVDKSIIEVIANSRVSISARFYPDPSFDGVSFASTGEASFRAAHVNAIEGNAFPERTSVAVAEPPADTTHAPAETGHADAAHGDGHAATTHVPPENVEFPESMHAGTIIGMAVISVLVIAIAGGVLGWLWIRKRRRDASATSDREVMGGESAISFGSK